MQNQWVWTADSKLGKFRGLSAKNRTKLEILLNKAGPRVDFKVTQGLFNKSARAKGYAWI